MRFNFKKIFVFTFVIATLVFSLNQNLFYKYSAFASNKATLPTASDTKVKDSLLKSDFFINDETAKNLVSKNTSYDMNELGLMTNQTKINKDVFAYKILSAFKTLGYRTDRGYNTVGNKPHILILNQFQAQYRLPKSDFLKKATLLKLDALMKKREDFEKTFASKFPLYKFISKLHPNDISKNHLAFLWYYPMTALPAKLQLQTAAQFVSCFVYQCGFKIEGYSGHPKNPGEKLTLYEKSLYNDGEPPFSLLSDQVFLHTYLHELAHYLDKMLYPRPLHLDVKWGTLNTKGFYDISYDVINPPDEISPFYNLKKKPNLKITDFISSYGWESRKGEDFAESFSSYVLSGKQFRKATLSSPVLKEKYDWLKKNVFENIEYDTDLPAGNATGCNDVPGVESQLPGYLSCNEENIWDGQIKKLSKKIRQPK